MARSQADRVFHGLCRPGTQSGPVVFFYGPLTPGWPGHAGPPTTAKVDFCTEIGPKPAQVSFRSFSAKLRSGHPAVNPAPLHSHNLAPPVGWQPAPRIAAPFDLPPRITPCPTSGCRRCNYGKAKAEYGRIVARHETADRVRLSPEWNKSVRSVAGKNTKNTGQPGATLQRFRKNVISF